MATTIDQPISARSFSAFQEYVSIENITLYFQYRSPVVLLSSVLLLDLSIFPNLKITLLGFIQSSELLLSIGLSLVCLRVVMQQGSFNFQSYNVH